ncbi:MAG: outer membrane protein assembly factor BamB [Saprospiraceae bacterium]|jgi:outer membrane protein assembly factor BamB
MTFQEQVKFELRKQSKFLILKENIVIFQNKEGFVCFYNIKLNKLKKSLLPKLNVLRSIKLLNGGVLIFDNEKLAFLLSNDEENIIVREIEASNTSWIRIYHPDCIMDGTITSYRKNDKGIKSYGLYDITQQKIIWQRPFNTTRHLVLDDKYIMGQIHPKYFNSIFTCLSKKTGDTLWQIETHKLFQADSRLTGNTIIGVKKEHIYIWAAEYNLLKVNINTGEIISTTTNFFLGSKRSHRAVPIRGGLIIDNNEELHYISMGIYGKINSEGESVLVKDFWSGFIEFNNYDELWYFDKYVDYGEYLVFIGKKDRAPSPDIIGLLRKTDGEIVYSFKPLEEGNYLTQELQVVGNTCCVRDTKGNLYIYEITK